MASDRAKVPCKFSPIVFPPMLLLRKLLELIPVKTLCKLNSASQPTKQKLTTTKETPQIKMAPVSRTGGDKVCTCISDAGYLTLLTSFDCHDHI